MDSSKLSSGRQSAIPKSNTTPGAARRLSFPPTPPRTRLSASSSPRRETVCPGASRKQFSPRAQSVSPVITTRICPGSPTYLASPTQSRQQSSRLSGVSTLSTSSPKTKYISSSILGSTCSCSEEEVLKKGLEKLSGHNPGKTVSFGLNKPEVTSQEIREKNPMMKNFMTRKPKETKEQTMYSFYRSADIEALMTGISDTTEPGIAEQLVSSTRKPCPSTTQPPCSQIPQLAYPINTSARSKSPAAEKPKVTCVCSPQTKHIVSPTSSRTTLSQSQQEQFKKQLKDVEKYCNLPLEAWKNKSVFPKQVFPAGSKYSGRRKLEIAPGTVRRLSFASTAPRTCLAAPISPRREPVCPGTSRKQIFSRTQSPLPVSKYLYFSQIFDTTCHLEKPGQMNIKIRMDKECVFQSIL